MTYKKALRDRRSASTSSSGSLRLDNILSTPLRNGLEMRNRIKFFAIAALVSCVVYAAWSSRAQLLPAGSTRPALQTLAVSSAQEVLNFAQSARSGARTQASTVERTHSQARHVTTDVDGDGKSDLLFDHVALGLFANWRMDGKTPIGYSPAFPKPQGYAQVASGDFNGDAKVDIVWARTGDRSLLMWTGNGTSFAEAPIRDYVEGWRITGAGDIDGDGKSDLLLANAAQSLFAYWIMDGTTPKRYSPAFTVPQGRVQVATGDFNGDGRLDIVWDNPTDRMLSMWMGDGNGFSQAPIGQRAVGWDVSAAGDVDGDGKSDLVLFNASRFKPCASCGGPGQKLFAYWIMRGATPVRYSPPFYLPSNMVPATVGDYNGDGKLDIALVDETRNLLMLLGDGNDFNEYYPQFGPLLQYNSGWQVVRGFGGDRYRLRPSYHRGDFNGDGKSDLALFGVNNGPASPGAAGHYFAHLLDGPVIGASTPISTLGCATSKPLATGDFNGDGLLDLVFERDCGGRETVMRFAAGSAFTDVVIPNPATGWSIIGAGRHEDTGDYSDLLLGLNVTPDGEMDAVAYWLMDGSRVVRFSAAFIAPAGHKKLVAKTDRLDLVWGGVDGSQRQTLVMWRAIGTGYVVPFTLPSPAAGWAVFAAGDIDGDGNADLLLSKTSGDPGIAYWIMQGVPVRYSPGFAYPAGALGVGSIVTGDFNDDGNLDLVFRIPTACGLRNCTDRIVMWIGDGNGFKSYDVGGVTSAYRLFNS